MEIIIKEMTITRNSSLSVMITFHFNNYQELQLVSFLKKLYTIVSVTCYLELNTPCYDTSFRPFGSGKYIIFEHAHFHNLF